MLLYYDSIMLFWMKNTNSKFYKEFNLKFILFIIFFFALNIETERLCGIWLKMFNLLCKYMYLGKVRAIDVD